MQCCDDHNSGQLLMADVCLVLQMARQHLQVTVERLSSFWGNLPCPGNSLSLYSPYWA